MKISEQIYIRSERTDTAAYAKKGRVLFRASSLLASLSPLRTDL